MAIGAIRIGVLGGTFDPPHVGHLLMAERARDQLSLAQVLFVPAGAPPHKLERVCTPVRHRVAMVKLAIADYPLFELSRVDVDRPAPSYTIEMLRLLRAEWGADTDFYLIMGMDSLGDIINWHEPAEIIERCYLAVVPRAGCAVDMADLETRLPGITARTHFIDVPVVSVSSSELRKWARQGNSIAHWVPAEVVRYITEHGLYWTVDGGQ